MKAVEYEKKNLFQSQLKSFSDVLVKFFNRQIEKKTHFNLN